VIYLVAPTPCSGKTCEAEENDNTFNSSFIRSDGGALDTNIVFQDGIGRIKSHLIICLVTVRQAEIIIQTFNLFWGGPEAKKRKTHQFLLAGNQSNEILKYWPEANKI
jgi:hypothetical protein